MTSSSSCPEVAPKVESLPPWSLVLHDDNVNKAEFVVQKVQEITKLEEEEAVEKVLEAHKEGKSVLLTTHKEKAELLVEMFDDCKITVTMEKA